MRIGRLIRDAVFPILGAAVKLTHRLFSLAFMPLDHRHELLLRHVGQPAFRCAQGWPQ